MIECFAYEKLEVSTLKIVRERNVLILNGGKRFDFVLEPRTEMYSLIDRYTVSCNFKSCVKGVYKVVKGVHLSLLNFQIIYLKCIYILEEQ